MTDPKFPDSAVIVLLPDATYKQARPKTKDHHLTVAFYGQATVKSPAAHARLRLTVDKVSVAFKPIPAKANGVGIFNAGLDGFAVVDLIDGIETLNVRALVTQYDGLDGVNIDIRHGFTPHITREFVAKEDRDYAGLDWEDIDDIEFTFDAVGLWFGDQRYEVSL